YKLTKRCRLPRLFFGKILKIFQEITNLSCDLLKIRHQYRTVAAVAYYSGMTIIQLYLYICIDSHTSALLRVIAINGAFFVILVLFSNFAFMAEMNSKAKLILPNIDYCLHRMAWQSRKTAKFHLLEIRELFSQDKIAVDFAQIFNMN